MIYNQIMKTNTLFIAPLVAISLFSGGCREKRQTAQDQTSDDTTQVVATPAETPEVGLNPQLRQVLGDGEGLIRGTNLGDALTDVKARETAEQFETSARHVGYTIEFSSLESADILYYHTPDGRIDKINVDLFLNDKTSVEQQKNELSAWLTRKYGPSANDSAESRWTTPGARITLRDVSKKKDFGLKLTFDAAGETVTVRK